MARLLNQVTMMLPVLLVALFAFFGGPQTAGDYFNLSACNGQEVIWCPSTGCEVCLIVTAMSSSIPLRQLTLELAVNSGKFSRIQTATDDEQANFGTITVILDGNSFNNDSVYVRVKTKLYNSTELYSNKYYIHRCKKPPDPSIKSVELSSSMSSLELTVLLQVKEDVAVSRCFNQTFIAYIANSTGAVLITLSNPRLSNDSLVFISNDTDLSNQPGLCVIIAAVSANLETNSSCVALENPVTNGTTILPTTIIPDVNTTSSNDMDDATGISVGIVVIVFICGGVLVLVLVLVLGLWCRNRKHKGSYQPPARDEKPLISIKNDRLNEVQPQNRPGCGPTPAAAAQGPQQQIKAYGSTTQEKKPDDVTETYRNPLGEGSTLGAEAEKLNSSMNGADMEATQDAGPSAGDSINVAVEVHSNVTPNEVQPQGQPGCGSTLAAASQGPQPVKDTNEHPVPMTDKVDSETVSKGEPPESVDEEGSNTLTKEDVVSDEEVKQSPPPAVETEDEIVDECVEEGLENYAEEHTKKIDEGRDDKFKARRMPQTATSRSRPNTENSEEQKPTIASGADASCGSNDIADEHIHPEEPSTPQAKARETTQMVGNMEPSTPQAKAGETTQMVANMNVTLSNMCDYT